MPKLVIASASYGLYAPEAMRLLSEVFDEIRRIDLKANEPEESTIGKVGDADALILGAGGRITRRVMLEAANLKIIARHGIGLDNVDLAAATELGIPVTYCRHTGEEVSVAEHTVALILACARRIVEADRAVREGRWGARVHLVGLELRGKTLGVIGLGAIGREVAQIMKGGFG
ncbi:MAG: NAD(P)-dependent oxidoreductase, partial [Thermofilaceae archaeon]